MSKKPQAASADLNPSMGEEARTFEVNAGGMEGDRIVLQGMDADGLPIRWSFNEMKPDSFVWRGEKSRDGGKTWKLEEEHHMKRRSG